MKSVFYRDSMLVGLGNVPGEELLFFWGGPALMTLVEDMMPITHNQK